MPTMGILLKAIDRVDSNYEKSVVMMEIADPIAGDSEWEECFIAIANRLSPKNGSKSWVN